VTNEEMHWLETRFRRLENLQMSHGRFLLEQIAEIRARLDHMRDKRILIPDAVEANLQFLESRAEEIRALVVQINNEEQPAPPPSPPKFLN
jgi:hypothetical protein